MDTRTLSVDQTRVNHQPGAILEFLSGFPEGTPVALETVGNYYWIVDEIEQAGLSEAGVRACLTCIRRGTCTCAQNGY
jgi:hypothetical protein